MIRRVHVHLHRASDDSIEGLVRRGAGLRARAPDRRSQDAAGHDPKMGQFTRGEHVKINAPGTAGHGREGHIVNNPEKSGGRHWVRTGNGQDFLHGANELRRTGQPPLDEKKRAETRSRSTFTQRFARGR